MAGFCHFSDYLRGTCEREFYHELDAPPPPERPPPQLPPEDEELPQLLPLEEDEEERVSVAIEYVLRSDFPHALH